MSLRTGKEVHLPPDTLPDVLSRLSDIVGKFCNKESGGAKKDNFSYPVFDEDREEIPYIDGDEVPRPFVLALFTSEIASVVEGELQKSLKDFEKSVYWGEEECPTGSNCGKLQFYVDECKAIVWKVEGGIPIYLYPLVYGVLPSHASFSPREVHYNSHIETVSDSKLVPVYSPK